MKLDFEKLERRATFFYMCAFGNIEMEKKIYDDIFQLGWNTPTPPVDTKKSLGWVLIQQLVMHHSIFR
jgi:hypothetical protein